jgi:HPt (histidine-containing phosphotransfer) domain-containing protein
MNAALELLTQRFRARCAEDRRALAALSAVGDADGVRNLAHKLGGAAGTFGFASLSDAALRLEDQMAYGDPPDPELLDVLDDLLAAVSEGVRA